MVEAAPCEAEAIAPRPPLLTRQIAWFLLCTVASFTSFYLLQAVTPLYASAGNGGSVAAGLTTGVMMFSAVLTELITPGLLARFGYRAVIAAGIVLLGAPTLALPLSDALPTILGVSLARGAGLAIVVVAGTALAAALGPDGRRGEMLGLYGLAALLPSIVGLPAGVWLSERLGFTSVFLLSAMFTPVALAASTMLPTLRPAVGSGGHNVLVALRWPGVARLTAVFTATTFAAGVFVTFLPVALAGDASAIPALALLAQSGATAASRWSSGRVGDRYGAARLLVPSMLVATLGSACLIAVKSPPAVVLGMALFGLGFGGVQNVTLTLMFDRAPHDEFGRVSVLWNLAFDAGLGIGAVGFGYLTVATGYPWGFAGVALLLLAAVVVSIVDRREERTGTLRRPDRVP